MGDIPGAGPAMIPEPFAAGVSITQFTGEVFSDPCETSGIETIEPSAQSFIDWLAAHPALESEDPTTVTLAGQEALQIDVSADVGETCPEPRWNFLWVLPPPAGDFHFTEQTRARVIATDIADTTVVVTVEDFEDQDFEGLLQRATPIVDSIRIAP